MSQPDLPSRRPCVTFNVERGSERYHVAVGISPVSGKPCEVFAQGPRAGSDSWSLLQDFCMLISKDLQHGADPEMLPYRFVRDGGGNAQSIAGELAERVAEVARECAAPANSV